MKDFLIMLLRRFLKPITNLSASLGIFQLAADIENLSLMPISPWLLPLAARKLN